MRFVSRRNRMNFLLVCILLVAAPGNAQEIAPADHDHAALSIPPEPGNEIAESFRLPQSHRSSIYFSPGSAELGESAMTSLAATAASLKADTGLRITVVGYTDDRGEATDAENLRAARAAAVVDALLAEGAPQQRVAAEVAQDEMDTLPCISEYCRQNYRRAGLLFSKAAAR